MEHDQQEGHLGARGVQFHEPFRRNDMGRTRDGQQLGCALHDAKDYYLDERGLHALAPWYATLPGVQVLYAAGGNGAILLF
jgi:hypothetical protein